MIGSRIFSEQIRLFAKYFFNRNENKIAINYLFNYIFISAFLKIIFHLEIVIAIRQVHKHLIKLPITQYYFGTTCIKVV